VSPVEGQPTAANPGPFRQERAERPNSAGQETTGGPQGQSTTGSKVDGQRTVNRASAEGQETGPRHPSRPNDGS
jgi:hypothetical protein